MSRTLDAPRWGVGALAAGVLSLVVMALLALGPAPRADAAFALGKCGGTDITGRGASFARDAHNLWIPNFLAIYCGSSPSEVTYEPLGSGAGRRSMMTREDDPRFGMSDEPPSPEDIEKMNTGVGSAGNPAADPDPSDNGKIHVFPGAVGAVAALVNFPDGCDVNDLNPESRTPEQEGENEAEEPFPLGVARVKFTRAEFEEVWGQEAGSYLNWDDVFPELTEGGAVPACEKPIIRVVRFDDSGTTFAFKDYLNSINEGRGWLTTYNGPNTNWPGAEFGKRTDCSGEPNGPGKEPDAIDHLTSGCANGNGNLVPKLVATDGSVGYSDVSTARTNNPSLEIEPRDEDDLPGEDFDNEVGYWIQLQNASDTFAEPTATANSYLDGGQKGSNCQNTTFENVPAGSFGDWSKVTGVNSPVGYGICTLTYGLVFDDLADPWGDTPEEEAKARTVKDYWENVVSDIGQALLFPGDYAKLPPAILATARAGIASVGWNKGAGGGGGGNNNNDDDGDDSSSSTPSAAAPPLLPVVPSNLFSLLRKQISSKTGQANLAVKLPGAGRLVVVGKAKVQVGGKKGKNRRSRRNRRRTKTVNVGQVALNANQAGTYNLKLVPRGAARRELRKKGRLPVSLRMTFLPNGGTANASNSRVVLKYQQNNKRKGKRNRGGKRR